VPNAYRAALYQVTFNNYRRSPTVLDFVGHTCVSSVFRDYCWNIDSPFCDVVSTSRQRRTETISDDSQLTFIVDNRLDYTSHWHSDNKETHGQMVDVACGTPRIIKDYAVCTNAIPHPVLYFIQTKIHHIRPKIVFTLTFRLQPEVFIRRMKTSFLHPVLGPVSIVDISGKQLYAWLSW